MINLGLFSSKTDMWETPQSFFDELNKEFNFDIDLCATLENAKCSMFITKEHNLLESEPWRIYNGKGGTYKSAWMNPPYGRQIDKFMRKAYECSFVGGMTVVCLVPARTDTRWWHDYAVKGEIRFIKGRLKFGGHKNSAPFPSAVIIFKGLKP